MRGSTFFSTWFVFVTVLGGCGGIKADAEMPASDPNADFVDGSRLKFGRWVTDEGYSFPTGNLYDTLRGEICGFVRAMDGRQRCMPLVFDVSLYPAFEDPACTLPLGQSDSSSMAPHYILKITRDGDCVSPSRVEYREVGARFEGTEIYQQAASGCVLQTAPLADNQVYYRSGAVIPAETFVGAEEVVAPTEGPLTVVRIQADDGTSYKEKLFDTHEQRSCIPLKTADGRLRCLPSPRYYRSTNGPIAGPDCSGVPLAFEGTCVSNPSNFIEETSSTDGAQGITIREPGIPWDSDPISSLTSTGCEPIMRANRRLVEAGSEIDPSRFVELESVPLGAHRLRLMAYVGGSGASVPQGVQTFDSAIGERCSFSPDSAGEYRCEPPMDTTWFTDDACREAVAVVYASPFPGGHSVVSKYLLVRGRLHTSGPKLDSPPTRFFLLARSGECFETPGPVEPLGYYAVGPEVGVDLVHAREERPSP